MARSGRRLRISRLKLSTLVVGLMVTLPALAQLRDAWNDPASVLVAPADAVGYYRMTEQATAALKQEKWSDAERLLKAITRDYPIDGARWSQLGSALQHQGKHAEAIAAYETAVGILGPDCPIPVLPTTSMESPSARRHWARPMPHSTR